MKRTGDTVFFDPPAGVRGYAAAVGKKEGEGPLGKCFDSVCRDNRFGRAAWEQAESAMVEKAAGIALEKAGLTADALAAAMGGDLLNQCIATSFANRALGAPFFGLYGACSTMAEGLVLGALMCSAGFAAPVLVSTGSGSHVALFSYFALLNTVILGIAWFKAWRPLNLIGFFGTFLIGLAWGLRSYQPEHYGSTQPFLILFFLMFVAIGLLFARRMLLADADTPQSGNTAEWLDWLARHGQRA